MKDFLIIKLYLLNNIKTHRINRCVLLVFIIIIKFLIANLYKLNMLSLYPCNDNLTIIFRLNIVSIIISLLPS